MHAKKRAEEEVIEALSDDKTIRLQTPTVISTVGSGVGKSTCSTLRSIGAGDFSTQSFNRVYILLTPYRHAAPLEMTWRQAAYTHWEGRKLCSVFWSYVKSFFLKKFNVFS